MNFKQILFRFSPYFGLLFVFLLFVILCPPAFYSFFNIKTIFTQTVIVGIAAMGATMVIISGGIDLSVGSQIALGTVVIAKVLNMSGLDGQASGQVSLLAAMLSIFACMACGVITGLVISQFRIVPFIVTLGMMQIARGVAKWLANEQTVASPANSMTSLMLVEPESEWLVLGASVWIMLILVVILSIILKYTILGRYIFAIGSNEQTARLCGINISKYKILIYMLSGVFTGIAAIMQFSNLTVGDPTAANGMELDIIAAVVIGGGSLSGGEGSAVGSLIGALMMAVLRNGCNMLGVPNYVQEIIIGLIIVGAVLIDKLKHRLR
ncbi:ABC transporter permease [Thermoflexibacter ruber]|uniref:Monosaccharide ABC transporter membrane protein, CUT2 family n=1 Tax=Thermoflexibacter ruber TaxID=1003 RepID=A0A1I2GLP7_9BACT|nr:ABC transporter permease [Thermoflexibacter ruber]SFF18505.1 monosaccharide ABC transporter membrane protein, CUT2 family [Thermoflexibacter ruber]